MENASFLEPPGAGMMENVMFFAADKRGNDGHRNDFEFPITKNNIKYDKTDKWQPHFFGFPYAQTVFVLQC
jgi:hypothetical protein